ncbi:UDP-glucuronosyltransferase [Marinithermofilum abyssi]|uniref:UDP-glucuronosyltransferase n=1 Tax=Marinithermofilum abyssi TaxID=1571185 RepID=A0A8J2VJ73_9BACL|nr:glycosyltransferase [Marinithermofilum abyssi]GGE23214.1 UDP-glucuronosyltransferase [Marinithermofilum abyssi]
MAQIWIMTETIGGNGHQQAARALAKGLAHAAPDVRVQIRSGLPVFSRSLESLTRTVYLNTLQYAPSLWGAAYSKEEEFSQAFRDRWAKILSAKLEGLFSCEVPEIVVCTHALCVGALARIKKRLSSSFRLGAAITDFDVNGFWVHPDVDFYLVAHEKVAEKLRYTYKIPADRIFPTGIPIDPDFAKKRPEKRVLREQLRLNTDAFTVLMMGGGGGMGPMESCIQTFLTQMPDVQLAVVTGKNEGLRQRLQHRFPDADRLHLFGYVDGIADLMQAADLLISKAGGLTTSEALAMGLPLLICRPIPGQEERNSRFLTSQRVALRQDQPINIPRHIYPLVQSPERWDGMKERARQLGRPRSALDGAACILKQLNH